MGKKLHITLILLSITTLVSCTANYKVHEYPHQNALGYSPANTTNIENLYHMDKKGNISLMPKNYNAPPATQPQNPFTPSMGQASYKNNARQMPARYSAPTAARQYSNYNQSPKQNVNNNYAQTRNLPRLQQGRRYPPLNNYPYPYKTNQVPIKEPKVAAQPKRTRNQNFNPQFDDGNSYFPEITTAYPPYQKNRNVGYQSNYLSNRNKQHLGLIDGNYFRPKSDRAINHDYSQGYNYKLSRYKQNNNVVDDVDNNILDGMIRNDPLIHGFKLNSLPSY